MKRTLTFRKCGIPRSIYFKEYNQDDEFIDDGEDDPDTSEVVLKDKSLIEQRNVFNLVCLAVNLLLTVYITRIFSEASKYDFLKIAKNKKLKWIKRYKRSWRVKNKIKQLMSSDNSPQKVSIKNFENFSLVLSNVFLVLGDCIILLDTLIFETDSKIVQYKRFFIGFGTFLSWLNLLVVLSSSRRMSITAKTLYHAVPQIGELLFSVVPIFFGFLMFGICLYHEQGMDSMQNTTVILLAMSVGDEILATFDKLAISEFPSFWAYFFILAFTVLFHIIIQNIIIFIMTTSYIKQRRNGEKWFGRNRRKSRKKRKKTQKKTISRQETLEEDWDGAPTVQLTRQNMKTTKFLRMRVKDILRDEVKRRTKFMFRANVETIKADIRESFRSKYSKGAEKISAFYDLINESVIEFERIYRDIRAKGNLADELVVDFRRNSRKYLDYVLEQIRCFRWVVTINSCKKDSQGGSSLPFDETKFAEYQHLVENSQKSESGFEAFGGLLSQKTSDLGEGKAYQVDSFNDLTLDDENFLRIFDKAEFEFEVQSFVEAIEESMLEGDGDQEGPGEPENDSESRIYAVDDFGENDSEEEEKDDTEAVESSSEGGGDSEGPETSEIIH